MAAPPSASSAARLATSVFADCGNPRRGGSYSTTTTSVVAYLKINSDATLYILYRELLVKYTGWCKLDFNMQGYASGDPTSCGTGRPRRATSPSGEGGAVILAAGIDRGVIQIIPYGMIRYVRRVPVVPAIN